MLSRERIDLTIAFDCSRLPELCVYFLYFKNMRVIAKSSRSVVVAVVDGVQDAVWNTGAVIHIGWPKKRR